MTGHLEDGHGRSTVLLVDDDELVAFVCGRALEGLGVEIVTVEDGQAALDVLDRRDVDLVLLDRGIPVLDGIETLRRIRSTRPSSRLPVIMLTGDARRELVLEALECGASDFLAKPVDPHILAARVQVHLDLRHAVKSLADARDKEIQIAARVQKAFLRGQPPRSDSLEIATLSMPSSLVDGDFYEFYEHDGGALDVVIGDVMGKGLPAALVGTAAVRHFGTALVHFLSRTIPRKLPDPARVIEVVADRMTPELLELRSFLTLCYARIESGKRRLSFVDCGHTKPILRRDGRCRQLEGDNLPLGLGFPDQYRTFQEGLAGGDLLVLYSDGVTDARDEHHELFGVERLVSLLEGMPAASPEQVVDAVRDRVVAHHRSETFLDDVTVIALALKPHPGLNGRSVEAGGRPPRRARPAVRPPRKARRR